MIEEAEARLEIERLDEAQVNFLEQVFRMYMLYKEVYHTRQVP